MRWWSCIYSTTVDAQAHAQAMQQAQAHAHVEAQAQALQHKAIQQQQHAIQHQQQQFVQMHAMSHPQGQAPMQPGQSPLRQRTCLYFYLR